MYINGIKLTEMCVYLYGIFYKNNSMYWIRNLTSDIKMKDMAVFVYFLIV